MEVLTVTPTELEQLRTEKEFIQNWLSDLLAAMDAELDLPTRMRLYQACGRGCYHRFEFKQAIARDGHGDLQSLIAAYQRNFEAWQAEDGVHIRYGETSSGCYCPAARFRPSRPDDLHCECTRATHQAVFEAALGHPVRMDVRETVRRGGKTCHFVARVQ